MENLVKIEFDDNEQFQNIEVIPNDLQSTSSVAENDASIDDDVNSQTKNSTITNKTNKIRKSKNKLTTTQKIDAEAKLERSRQSARECRARKKLRYQYLEDLVAKREQANIILKKELEDLKKITKMILSEKHSLDEIKKRYADV